MFRVMTDGKIEEKIEETIEGKIEEIIEEMTEDKKGLKIEEMTIDTSKDMTINPEITDKNELMIEPNIEKVATTEIKIAIMTEIKGIIMIETIKDKEFNPRSKEQHINREIRTTRDNSKEVKDQEGTIEIISDNSNDKTITSNEILLKINRTKITFTLEKELHWQISYFN